MAWDAPQLKQSESKLSFHDNTGEIGLFDGHLFDSFLAKKGLKLRKTLYSKIPPPPRIATFFTRKPQVASFERGRGWGKYKFFLFFFLEKKICFFLENVFFGKAFQKCFEIPKPQVASFEELESGNPWRGEFAVVLLK